MVKVETFREYKTMEDSLGRKVQSFLNNSHISPENIIDIKYTSNDEWLYCMIIYIA